MSSTIAATVDMYIRAVSERDPAVRAAMLDACFADNARFVTRERVMFGRAAIAEMIERFQADPKSGVIRVKAIDARGRTFRFAVINERADGSAIEVFDAGELDDEGRIALILTFAGPLGG